MPVPCDRDGQIRTLMAGWQAHFHDCFDADPPVENDGPRPDTMGELGSDFRVLTGFGWLTPDTRTACLAPFPNADQVTLLVEQWMGPATTVSEPDAHRLMEQGLAQIAAVLNGTDIAPGEYLTELSFILPEMAFAAGGVEAEAAVLFLTELMYWQGSSYTGASFVCWALAAPGQPNPMAPIVALEKGGWHMIPDGDTWTLQNRTAQ